MTGQGYHFSFRVKRGTGTHKKLESLGKVIDSLKGKYAAVHGRRTHPVADDCALGFDGMGRLLEYIVHRVVREHQKNPNAIPLVCTDVAIGKGEAISLDLSMYGDPIYMRDIRCPFSSYQKHKVATYKYGENTAREIPVQISVPRLTDGKKEPLTLESLFSMRRHFRNSAEYAAGVNTVIPERSTAVEELIAAYQRDPLYKFHQEFDREVQDPPHRWQFTYDRFNTQLLPRAFRIVCTSQRQSAKPTNLQTLTAC